MSKWEVWLRRQLYRQQASKIRTHLHLLFLRSPSFDIRTLGSSAPKHLGPSFILRKATGHYSDTPGADTQTLFSQRRLRWAVCDVVAHRKFINSACEHDGSASSLTLRSASARLRRRLTVWKKG